MIYETTINFKNYQIYIEFDSNTEEFSYTIKERKQANAKKESFSKDKESGRESRDNTGKSSTESRTDSDDFLG